MFKNISKKMFKNISKNVKNISKNFKKITKISKKCQKFSKKIQKKFKKILRKNVKKIFQKSDAEDFRCKKIILMAKSQFFRFFWVTR